MIFISRSEVREKMESEPSQRFTVKGQEAMVTSFYKENLLVTKKT